MLDKSHGCQSWKPKCSASTWRVENHVIPLESSAHSMKPLLRRDAPDRPSSCGSGVNGASVSTFRPSQLLHVAPLTTVVMNSVGEDRVRTASGIKNAVARVASVLAIAVLGIVMVKAFGSRLNGSLANFSLPPSVLQELQANEIKLAGLQVPASLCSITKSSINESIGEAFVFGFRIIMLICAGMSLGSGAVAWLLIRKGRDT